jgi:hypothetical protein
MSDFSPSSSSHDGNGEVYSGNDNTLNVLGHPILRQSDLLDDSGSVTRWDHLVVVPDNDDNVLVILWWLTGSVCLFVTVSITIVLLAILKSKPAMKFGFNIYLVALMIPDWIHTSQSALVWYLSASAGRYVNQSACYYQSWFTYFGLGGTAWINAIVAYELWVRIKRKWSLPRWVGHDDLLLTEICPPFQHVYIYTTGNATVFAPTSALHAAIVGGGRPKGGDCLPGSGFCVFHLDLAGPMATHSDQSSKWFFVHSVGLRLDLHNDTVRTLLSRVGWSTRHIRPSGRL